MLGRFIIFLLLSVTGFFMMWKTKFMMDTFGRVAWAEAKLGSTWTFYKLLGIFIIILAFLIVGGRYIDILNYLFVRDNVA